MGNRLTDKVYSEPGILTKPKLPLILFVRSSVVRFFCFTIFFSVILISCGGPKIVIQYQGSSPLPPSQSDSTESREDSLSNEPATYVTVLSIPTLEGGNRALRKRIDYPEKAIQNGIEGDVTIQFTINEDGSTSNFVVVDGIGYGCEEAVIQAIKESQFKPGQLNHEKNDRYTWMVTTEFKL